MRNLNDSIPGAPNFKYKEFLKSNTATANGINNSPNTEAQWKAIEYLAINCLQPAREHFGVPLKINSGFRSSELNKAIGGSTTSFHSIACAADIEFAGKTSHTLWDLFDFFYKRGIYTELIAEELPGGWIHIALQKGRDKENQLKYKLSGKSVKRASYEEIKKIVKS